jgi:hypothetical protein
MSAVAGDRGDDWDAQRADLVRRCGDVVTNRAARDGIARSASIEDALGAPPEGEARQLVARCLGAKEAPASFEIKGGRSARVFAEAIVEAAGVPAPFAAALTNLARWVATGSTPGFRHDIPVP